jgi:hypothetical protein
MLRNLLTTVIIWIYDTYKNFVSIPNHRIMHSSMEYFIGSNSDYSVKSQFWENESKKWDGLFDEHYVESKDMSYRGHKTPNNVRKVIIRIKYWYNDKLYKYLTYNTGHAWPPEQAEDMVFNIPLVSAYLVDAGDKPVKDVLNKIKRYAGPRGDFHGEKVKISDMLYYDIETLKTMYPSIKLKNVFGKTKNVSTVDGYITDLTVF